MEAENPILRLSGTGGYIATYCGSKFLARGLGRGLLVIIDAYSRACPEALLDTIEELHRRVYVSVNCADPAATAAALQSADRSDVACDILQSGEPIVEFRDRRTASRDGSGPGMQQLVGDLSDRLACRERSAGALARGGQSA
jgi:hypothetical protein